MVQNFTTTFSEDELAALIEGAVYKVFGSRNELPKVEIIDRDELMQRLKISEPTVLRYEKKGKIPRIEIGSSIRYDWTAVLKELKK